MKKTVSIILAVVVSLIFMTDTNYAQSKSDIGKILKYQFNKFFDLAGDGQKGSDDAQKVRKRLKLKDGTGECNGFVDEDGDGACDNCGGTGDCDRTRDKEGKGKKNRGGN